MDEPSYADRTMMQWAHGATEDALLNARRDAISTGDRALVDIVNVELERRGLR